MHFVRLLDDQTFEFVSTYPLDQFECGCSVLSCSFSDDTNVYYCVGTAYVMPEENEPTKVSLYSFHRFFFVFQPYYSFFPPSPPSLQNYFSWVSFMEAATDVPHHGVIVAKFSFGVSGSDFSFCC